MMIHAADRPELALATRAVDVPTDPGSAAHLAVAGRLAELDRSRRWNARRGRPTRFRGRPRANGDARFDQLRSLAAFRGCPTGELAEIRRRVDECHLRPGEPILHQGSSAREVVVIVEGTATVLIDDEPIAVVGPGEPVGEIGLLAGTERTASVIADTAVTALVIDPRSFAALRTLAPTFIGNLLVRVAERLAATDQLLHRSAA